MARMRIPDQLTATAYAAVTEPTGREATHKTNHMFRNVRRITSG